MRVIDLPPRHASSLISSSCSGIPHLGVVTAAITRTFQALDRLHKIANGCSSCFRLPPLNSYSTRFSGGAWQEVPLGGRCCESLRDAEQPDP